MIKKFEDSEADAVCNKLKEAILKCDEGLAKDVAREVLEKKVNPLEAIEKGLATGIREIGDKFEKEEIWLPELLLSADVAKAVLNIIMPGIATEKKYWLGTVVIGTIQGDIHDMGKNIISSMLQANGFRVYDLGKDVPPRAYIEKAEEVGADIIAGSALMTTTRPVLRGIIDWLEKEGIRGKYKVIVGGGAVTPEFANQIGADGYAKDVASTVRVAKELLGIR